MPKRKITYIDNESGGEEEENDKKKQKRIIPKLILENSPNVNNLKDLIEIGKTLKFYKNIDSIVLWEILPYIEELDNMIGMQSLKNTVFYQIIYYLQNMHQRNKNQEYLHTVITGNAGCGKTSVAKIIGKIYTNLNVLSNKNNSFKIGYRDDFIAEYLGQTAIKTREFLESCLGGVLFIDEVYSLGPGQKDKDSFSKEAIDTLCSFLSEHKNDFCCIVAGYKTDIKKCFFSVNQGLERRFPWRHDIDQYSETDLTEIFIKMVNETKWILHEEVEKKHITDCFKNNKDHFKHTGGSIETFISKLKMVHSKRVFSLEKELKFIINKEDIKNGLEEVKKHNVSEPVKIVFNMYT